MWFKNLQMYRLPAGWKTSLTELEQGLEKKLFQPCGSQDREVRGWVPPREGGALVHSVGGQFLLAMGIEDRLLPASVVRQVADDRAADLAAERGYKPGRKEMKELREAITQELLPRAFTRRRRIHAWIDPVDGWLCVDAASVSRAEALLELLRDSLDELPLALLRSERSPVAAMSEWLAAGEAPAGFSIDQDCELRSLSAERAAVRYVQHTLEGEEIRAHLAAGKVPTRLALTFDDRLSFVLTDTLELKRLAFLDVIKETAEQGGEEGDQLFDASFALMTGELQRLLPALLLALGGEKLAS